MKLEEEKRSLVVSDLRSETKGSRFESGCQLCAEEAGGSGREELNRYPPLSPAVP